MYTRPKPNETEEEILKLQDEFLKQSAENKLTPAAKIVRDPNYVPLEPPMIDSNTQLSNTFETIPTDINIGRILEKSFVPEAYRPATRIYNQHGFPQAKRRDPSLSGTKASIFSQQIKRIKHETITQSELTIKENTVTTSNRSIPQQSYVVTGNERDIIHQENAARLQQMSETEILKERQALLSTMDPAIVAFLKSKRKDIIVPNRNPSIAEQNKIVDNLKLEEVEVTKDIITQSESDRWLNFDAVELNKLAWTMNVNIPHNSKDQQYEARFDFSGWLLPFSHPAIDEKNRTLYHHGDEPGRPGYTLQELFQLSRSSVIQQKVVALNSISNILALYQSGVYDGIFDIPFEQVFFVLRVCLDDNTPSILNAAIRAVRNLFVYAIDETCLDNLLGFGLGMVQPLLAIDCTEVDDDNTVNDQQLAENNLVKCLVRTDILKRIRYVINTVKPSIETVVYCLEILNRLARDSNYISNQIQKCDSLLDSICKYFIPPIIISDNQNSAYGCPLIQAVKLFRLLAVRSKYFAEKIMNKYRIMDSIIYYLSSESLAINSIGLKLQIESMHLLCILLSYNLGTNYFSILSPILLGMLDYHVRNTNLYPCSYVRQGHAAAILILLHEASKHSCDVTNFVALLKDMGMFKWKQQFCALQEYSCGKLQIIIALLKFFSNFGEVPNMEGFVLSLLQSKGFEIVTNNIQLCSNILNNYETHKMSANLKTVEAAAWNASEHIIPILQTNSCLLFLASLTDFIIILNNTKVILTFLKLKNIVKYLKYLNNANGYNLTTNWFTRIESSFIMNILKMAVRVSAELECSLYYEVAVKCLSIFNNTQKLDIQYILKNIIFNRNFYPCEALISNLELNEQHGLLNVGLDNLQNICNVYVEVLDLKMEVTNLLVSLNDSTIIPVDWIYSPIILFYSNHQNTKNMMAEDQQIFIITNCLRWIFIYETYFPALANTINATDRFCRIACTFLCSDTLFLNHEVYYLLEYCLKHIVASNEHDINFSRPIEGLSNFQDFYTLLLEQYQGVSYGNILFGNFILLPLMQRHNIKYRKTLWSEYAGVVQIFNVTFEQLLCPVNLFLYPVETDVSLLKCYRKALVMQNIRKQSVLYQIANHHVTMYLNSKKNIA